jgi:glycosyltransferase involved in cell wall biosynthesis
MSHDQIQPAKRSVLLLAGDPSAGGGVNRVIRDLSAIMTNNLGMAVTVLARSDAAPTYAFPPGVQILSRPEARTTRGAWTVLRELSRDDYDHVIGFWHWDNIRIGLFFRRAAERAILTEHTSWYHPPFKTRVARALAYRSAKAVCVLNDVELEHYRKYLPHVVMLPNPVPKPALPSGVVREKLIIAVGHLIDRKNFQDAVAAMAASGLAAEGWRLAIIGSGPEEPALRAQIAESGLAHSVSIEPPSLDLPHWYARASLMLVTSKIEVFSLVLAEAMAVGVVPLAFAADGPAFLLRDTPELLVALGDVEALGAKLGRLGRALQLEKEREAVERTIANRFSEEVVANEWRKLLS